MKLKIDKNRTIYLILTIISIIFVISIIILTQAILNNNTNEIETNQTTSDKSVVDIKTKEEKEAEINMFAERPSAAKIVNMVNDERSKVGAPPLIQDERLNLSAQAKANDMRDNGYYGHDNPQTGKTGYEYIFDYAPNLCNLAGENIDDVMGLYPNKFAMDDWMGSKTGHREAILDLRYSMIGVGWVELTEPGEFPRYYIVQHFCEVK